MELIAVSPHPRHPTPPPNKFVGEQVDAYDGTLESQRHEYAHATGRIFGILLNWSSSKLGRPSWYQDAGRTLVKSGMPCHMNPLTDLVICTPSTH